MKTIFDSILLNRIQFESSSKEVQLDCCIYENGNSYESQIFMSMSAFNQLLCELSVRGIDLDMDENLDTIVISDSEIIYSMDLTSDSDKPIFLPYYCLPEQNKLLRA
ncbi:hypothetical protein [Fluviicola sp.]|uniref:hypothetical protein n=1 Tax=Fluviicola sp. TaxID=1917219 RepID=UPI0031DFC80E